MTDTKPTELRCDTCGKPMKQTAIPAAKAWCNECYDQAKATLPTAAGADKEDGWLAIESAPKEPTYRFSERHWRGSDILCCHAENVRQGAAMTINHLNTLNGGETWGWAFWQVRPPTHWQPLPTPPEGE